jgi:hypothetical protein
MSLRFNEAFGVRADSVVRRQQIGIATRKRQRTEGLKSGSSPSMVSQLVVIDISE